MIASLVVFAGSRTSKSKEHSQAALELGKLIGERQIRLIYGGARSGLMGLVADAALAAGGHVIGVIPTHLLPGEEVHPSIQEKIFVSSMSERKEYMMAVGDVFVALPGGMGTLEEITTMLSATMVDRSNKLLGLLNIGGYYDPLISVIARMISHDFVTACELDHFIVAENSLELVEKLQSLTTSIPIRGA